MAGRKAQKAARQSASDIGTNVEQSYGCGDGMNKGKTNPSEMSGGPSWDWEDERPEDVVEPGGMGQDW